MPNDSFFFIEEQIILLLFVASLVGIVARRLRMPYTVGLVLVGLGLAVVGRVELKLTSDLILGLLLPPLVFEAAYHLNFEDLQKNLKPILILTIPGVIITAVFVGGVVSLGAGFSFQVALLFGTLVAATDPDAVVALIRSLGVPRRLQVLLEGESLLNDGTVFVLFSLMLNIFFTGKFSLIQGIADFFMVAGGGIGIGFLLGYLISQMISRINDHLLETTLTTVLAYGAYLIGESLGVSGVMAVVTAGLVNGNIGTRGMSPTTRIVVFNFWEYAAFLATTFIFLLIGLQIDIRMLIDNWSIILWAIISVLIARAIVVYSLKLFSKDIPLKWQHVIFWGGLRGALAPALALGLPAAFGEVRSQLQAMVFGVILFNLLIQGITMGPLIRKLNIVQRSETQDEYERRHARAVAARSAHHHLEQRFKHGLISHQTWSTLANLLKRRMDILAEAVGEVMKIDPSVEAEELDTAWREALLAQRSAYASLLRDGIITENTFDQLLGEVDLALTQPAFDGSAIPRGKHLPPIRSLITAFVQKHDVRNIVNTFHQHGFPTNQLPSTGGFLKGRNTTLFIGAPQEFESAAIQILEEHYGASPERSGSYLDEALSNPAAQPADLGGVTIFTLDVERYEEF